MSIAGTMTSYGMRVCFFGIFNPDYARTRVLQRGFEKNGWEVVYCRADPTAFSGARKYIELIRQRRKLRDRFDLVIVCYPGHTVVWLARLLFGNHIVFDAFLSLYDSQVCDRGSYSPRSLRAWRDRFWDRVSCRLAWRVLLDTKANIGFFRNMYGFSEKKFVRVFIGADDSVFRPFAGSEAEKFTVHFHGSFLAVQGVPIVLDAAALLRNEDVAFQFVGSGSGQREARQIAQAKNLSNVIFHGRVPLERMPEFLGPAHIALGMFSTKDRADRAVPNKVYESMAMGKAIITADSKALRELTPDAREVYAIPAGDARALADAILKLRLDTALRKDLGRRALALFRAKLAPEMLVGQLILDIGV